MDDLQFLSREDVRDDLKLTDAQKAKVKDLGGRPFKRVDPQPGQRGPGRN